MSILIESSEDESVMGLIKYYFIDKMSKVINEKMVGLDSTRGTMNLLRMLDQKPAGGF